MVGRLCGGCAEVTAEQAGDLRWKGKGADGQKWMIAPRCACCKTEYDLVGYSIEFLPCSSFVEQMHLWNCRGCKKTG